MAPPLRTRLTRALGALAAASAAGVAGWTVTDALERRDTFCVSCHLSEDVPLHIEKFEDARAVPPASLVAAHAAAGLAEREDGGFRCIDCHGGSGPWGRTRIKLVSAHDAFWYAVGHFDEPREMRWPLRDEDCAKCHVSFDETAHGGADPRFHELAVHNVDLGVACVECHVSHPKGGLAEHYFLHPDRVRSQCARCHPEFEEGQG